MLTNFATTQLLIQGNSLIEPVQICVFDKLPINRLSVEVLVM